EAAPRPICAEVAAWRQLRVQGRALHDRERAAPAPALEHTRTPAVCNQHPGTSRFHRHTSPPDPVGLLSLVDLQTPPKDSSFGQRQISTGTELSVSTRVAWLPSRSLESPRRPWEAITIRSQPLALAAATMPSAGKSLMCSVSLGTPASQAAALTPARMRLAFS